MRHLTDRYLAQEIDYGGEPMTLGALIEEIGAEEALAWFAGYSLRHRIKSRRFGVLASQRAVSVGTRDPRGFEGLSGGGRRR